MSEKDGFVSIPTWDGQAKGWRRYTKEVAWFVSSTPVEKRRYAASKLISRLQGPARLLAMSWNRGEFDSPDGTLNLLRKLNSSPLVRRTLPNTAAILQQYLSFRRRPHEGMATFLVRETLGYEEFAESLLRLWEEKNGVSQSEVNFGLPPIEDSSWDWWYENYDDDEPHPDEPGDPSEPPRDPVASAGEVKTPTKDASASDGAARASAGSSPSHGEPARRAPSVISAGIQAPSTMGVNELSVTDSFIMGVLQGWRLLQAACLNPEETRDILSATQNSLDFEAISRALQTLWDEQLLGHRPSSSSSNPSYGHLNWQSWEEDEWHAPDPWDNEDSWWESQWHEEWQDDHLWPDEEPASSLAIAEEPDEQILEAQKAEQAAEQLALEAKRTWAEAQRTTQQMKKDRGFGQHTSNKCFNCGGNHFVRDCPDRRVPMFGKHGKGKGK